MQIEIKDVDKCDLLNALKCVGVIIRYVIRQCKTVEKIVNK